MPMPPKPENAAKPHAMHGAVLAGDQIYIRHPKAGPMAVTVLAAGKDGVTAECEKNGRYRVPYDHVLGHRARMLQQWTVEDQGVDGAILKGPDGARRFMEGEVPTAEPVQASQKPAADDPLTGGLDRLRKPKDDAMMKGSAILFLKAGSTADRRATKTPDRPKGHGAGTAAAGGNRGEPPAAPLKHGDTARFRHGDVEGAGKIIASGQDGVTLQAEDGREHQVRHEDLLSPGEDETDGDAVRKQRGDRDQKEMRKALVLFAKAI